jgi:hypothetical protein
MLRSSNETMETLKLNNVNKGEFERSMREREANEREKKKIIRPSKIILTSHGILYLLVFVYK